MGVCAPRRAGGARVEMPTHAKEDAILQLRCHGPISSRNQVKTRWRAAFGVLVEIDNAVPSRFLEPDLREKPGGLLLRTPTQCGAAAHLLAAI